MSSEHSFDIVSTMDMQELNNAIQQAEKEIATRFDFKGSKTSIALEKNELVVVSDDEFKLNNVLDIFRSKICNTAKSSRPLRPLSVSASG